MAILSVHIDNRNAIVTTKAGSFLLSVCSVSPTCMALFYFFLILPRRRRRSRPVQIICTFCQLFLGRFCPRELEWDLSVAAAPKETFSQ